MTARTARLAGSLAGVAGVAAVTLAVVVRTPEWSLAGESGAALAFEVSAGLVVALAGGALALQRPVARSGALFIAAAAAWLAAEWNNPGALGSLVFTIGMLTAELAPAVVAHAVLVHGRERPGTALERCAAVAAYGVAALVLGVGTTLVSDPIAQGCGSCPANLLALADAPTAVDALRRLGLWLGIAALTTVVLLSIARLWRASVPRRRAVAPVVVPGVAFLGLVVGRYAHELARGFPALDATERGLRLAEAGAFLGIAAGVVWQRVAVRRMRSRVAAVVLELADAVRPGELAKRLAGVLADPTLEVLYPDEGAWIDAHGRPRSLPRAPERELTSLAHDGEVAAVVAHRPGLLADPRLVEELGRAARLALDHERLRAQLLAHVERLRRSRAAIVAAADEQRRRLERDLHDGAQQGLAGVAMGIALAARSRSGEDAALLELAQARVRAALDRVRTIAHGLYPAALGDAGLAAALDVLAEWRPQLELGTLPDERFDPALEAGAYFVVATLTEPSAPAAVSAAVAGDELVLDVRTAEVGDIAEAEDRVGALGGRMSVRPTSRGDTQVRVELPCA